MQDQFTYYTPEAMKGKKLSDLKNDAGFLKDAVTFLKGSRKEIKDDKLKSYTPSDVVYEILEHFRVMNTNEVSMAKDYYYISDDNIDEKEKQSYARLYNAFSNAKGEDILDGGFAAPLDYAEGFFTAPTTYISAAAIPLTAGTGSVAIQAAKEGGKEALKQLTKKLIKRGLLDATFEGSVAAASQLGAERIRQKAGKTIGEDYDISGKRIAAAGVIGGVTGGLAYAIPTRQQYKGAERMVEVVKQGDSAKAARMADATNRAVNDLQKLATTSEGRKYIRFTKNKLLASIDPKLVEEGMEAKINILSKDLPDGIIGGLDRGTIQRISAAAVELSRALGVKPEKGQRITEYLARRVEDGDGVQLFDSIANKYGLTRRQLAAVYAAEVSESARILVQQKQFKTAAGKKITGNEAVEAAGKFKDKLDQLYDEGMSTISGREAEELTDAALQISTSKKIVRTLKDVEDTRRAFMTSQPATTMRNNIFGIAMTGIDILDQFNTFMIRSVTGKDSSAATLNGTLDIARYLVKDQYVADTAVQLLRQDAPELMQRAFRDAALTETNVLRNTKLSKLGAFVNTLNTVSDHIFKKAVVAGTIDRELKKRGSSLKEYLEKGMISEIPDDIITKSLDDSLAFTFQRRFGGKDASDTNKLVGKTIGTIHKYGLTTIIPFPRYMASQAKFVKDYSILNIAYKGFKLTDEEWAKQLTGGAMFYSAYIYQKDNIEQGLKWFEDKLTTNQVTNAQAAMGPAAPMHYATNVLTRVSMGLPNDLQDNPDMFLKNVSKLMIGTEFRPGGTIIDEMVTTADSLLKGNPNYQPLVKVFGDYFSTYTYPAAVVKDFYGQFDPRSSYIPQTLDATVSLADIGGPRSPRIYLYNRFAKGLPDFNLSEMSNTLKETTGIDLGEPELEGLLKWMGSSSRTHFQLMDPDNKDTGYDVVRHDVFGDGPIRQLDPLLKQITGFTKEPPKNKLKLEMARLNIDPFKIYNPYREKNNALELFTQQIAQGDLAEKAEQFMKTDLYKNLSEDPRQQKRLLEGKVRTLIVEYRDTARSILSDYARKKEEYRSDYNAYVRGEYKAMGPKEKAQAEDGWETLRDRYGFSDMSIEDAIATINSDQSFDEDEKDARRSVLLNWYISAGKAQAKAEREVIK